MHGIAIFGCGYVGLVTGACLAQLGHDVTCYDSDLTKIRALQAGQIPFYEPGLQPLVASQIAAEQLQFTNDPACALSGARMVFIAVGTPTGPTGEADLTHVRQAAREIAGDVCGRRITVAGIAFKGGTRAACFAIAYVTRLPCIMRARTPARWLSLTTTARTRVSIGAESHGR